MTPFDKPIKLIKWGVVIENNPYIAPEVQPIQICGILVNDTKYPRKTYKAGKEIITSYVTNIDGRIIHTQNSIYELVGEPSDSYAKWCNDNGITIDNDYPIKLK